MKKIPTLALLTVLETNTLKAEETDIFLNKTMLFNNRR